MWKNLGLRRIFCILSDLPLSTWPEYLYYKLLLPVLLNTNIHSKPPPCWKAQKLPTMFLKKLTLWRKKKIRPKCIAKKKKSLQKFPPRLKKVRSDLCAQNKPLKPIKFTKPKIVLFTFQIFASTRHSANMLRLQNVQVDKDMQRWPFNKSRLL